MHTTYINQERRLLYLVIYIVLLFIASYLAFGSLLPAINQKGLWFYTGLASLLLGSMLVTPYFTNPANAISYSIAALIGVIPFKPNNAPLYCYTAYYIMVAYCLFVLIVCFSSIIFKKSKNTNLQNIANASRLFSEYFGNPRFVYTIILVYALLQFHRTSTKELFIISSFGFIIVFIQPLEMIHKYYNSIKSIWRKGHGIDHLGNIIAYQTPNIVLVRHENFKNPAINKCLLINDPYSNFKLGLSLDYVGRDEGLLLRAIQLRAPETSIGMIDKMCGSIQQHTVSIIDKTIESQIIADDYILQNSKNLVGIVTKDTSIDHLYFEVVNDSNLEVGKLVETYVAGKLAIYQLIDGLTREEIVFQKNTFGYARAKARQIGMWDSSCNKFIPSKWIPNINSPVLIKTADDYTTAIDDIGHFPGSSYPVKIKNINHLITHNTAILGILGVGKSMLSIELVERMIFTNIKVIVVDLTNQYANELSNFYNAAEEELLLGPINDIGKKGKLVSNRNMEEGGSVKQFSAAITADLQEFIKPDNTKMLKIYNPSYFEVWKQVGNPYPDGRAAMATLTPSEITQIITESGLSICRSYGMTDVARVCVVFEEAHTLIPEKGSIASKGDESASNGTARAILQGRKYGFGCLLITQRTANVTKTILNQCHTIFAMRCFDETGKDFLSNYFGSDYANLLSSLPERHAIFFGKASSCENPVMLRLNDRDKFINVFRSIPVSTDVGHCNE